MVEPAEFVEDLVPIGEVRWQRKQAAEKLIHLRGGGLGLCIECVPKRIAFEFGLSVLLGFLGIRPARSGQRLGGWRG
jgi:hypothetical protein